MNNLFDLRKYIIAGILTIMFFFVARLFYMQIIDDQDKSSTQVMKRSGMLRNIRPVAV